MDEAILERVRREGEFSRAAARVARLEHVAPRSARVLVAVAVGFAADEENPLAEVELDALPVVAPAV